MSAQLADELERAVALSKGLASSSSASASAPLDGSPEAALDVAEGVNYLHTFAVDQPVLHRGP